MTKRQRMWIYDIDIYLSDDDDDVTAEMFKKQHEKINKIKASQEARKVEAKSNITLDIKPIGTEVDLDELEKQIRKIEMPGVKWLAATKLDIAYGIKKIRMMAQLADVLTDPDSITEEIGKFEDVQSTDIVAFQMA